MPSIPAKQFVGDKEEGFIEERRSLLERFLRECSKYDFLVESKEFDVFKRGQGEIQDKI